MISLKGILLTWLILLRKDVFLLTSQKINQYFSCFIILSTVTSKVYLHVDPQTLKLKSVTKAVSEDINIYKEKKDRALNFQVQITTAICSMHTI